MDVASNKSLSDTQPIQKQRQIPSETVAILRTQYLNTKEISNSQPHQSVLNAESIMRDIFVALFLKKFGEAPEGMSMSEIFLAVRDLVPHYVQVELETIGFAYYHALHSPMVRMTNDSDYLLAGMEGLDIIFEWFENSQEKTGAQDEVPSQPLSKTIPLFKAAEKSMRILNDQLIYNPNDVNALLNRGVLFNNEGKVMSAINDFDTALTLDASVAEVYFHRGNSYQLLGDFERALENYQYALDLNMESAALYHARGMVYYKMENPGQAYVNFDLAMAIERRYSESKRHKKQLKKAKRFSLFKRN